MMVHLENVAARFIFVGLMVCNTAALADASQTDPRDSSTKNPQSELIANNPALVNPKDPTGVRSNIPGARPGSASGARSNTPGVNPGSPTGVNPPSPSGINPSAPTGVSPTSPTGVSPSGPLGTDSGSGSGTSGY